MNPLVTTSRHVEYYNSNSFLPARSIQYSNIQYDPYSTATSTTKITTVKASGSFHVIVSFSTKNRSFKFSHCSITEIELVLLTNTSDGFTIKLYFNFFLTDVYHITCMHCILIKENMCTHHTISSIIVYSDRMKFDKLVKIVQFCHWIIATP